MIGLLVLCHYACGAYDILVSAMKKFVVLKVIMLSRDWVRVHRSIVLLARVQHLNALETQFGVPIIGTLFSMS